MGGYEDINSQRKVENNYKFSWKEDMVDEIERKIDSLGYTEADTLQENQQGQEEGLTEEFSSEEVKPEHTEPEEVILTDNPFPFDFYDGGDQRQRPSSSSSEIEDSINSDEDEEGEIYSEGEEDTKRDEL